MFGSSPPPLSSTARALLAAERGRGEDEELKARALERAKAALDGERWSGIALRRTNRPSRALRSALLVAASLSVAGLAMAGAHWAAQRSPRPVAVAAPRSISVPTSVARSVPQPAAVLETAPAP